MYSELEAELGLEPRSPVSHWALYHPHCPGTCSCGMFIAPCVIQAGFVPGNLPLSHPRYLLTTPTQAVSTSCHILILNIPSSASPSIFTALP